MTTSTNGTHTHTTTREQNYRRALDACPDIRALDNMVRLIAELGPPRPKRSMCYACIWDSALKPLANLVVGWERGRGVESHTETEEWLCDMEAFDAVTETWLKLLEDVDPALGHGFLAPESRGPRRPGVPIPISPPAWISTRKHRQAPTAIRTRRCTTTTPRAPGTPHERTQPHQHRRRGVVPVP
jgi:hypothetical protein